MQTLQREIRKMFRLQKISMNTLSVRSFRITRMPGLIRRKTKVGYEIPFTRTFYEYKQVEPSDVIAKRIEEHEKSLMAKLHNLFGEG